MLGNNTGCCKVTQKEKNKQLCLLPHHFLLLVSSNDLFYLLRAPHFVCLYREFTGDSQTSHCTVHGADHSQTGQGK